jgi:hypothetical protein
MKPSCTTSQPDLFEPGRMPAITLTAAQAEPLAPLVEALLLEIAEALASGEAGNEQDQC